MLSTSVSEVVGLGDRRRRREQQPARRPGRGCAAAAASTAAAPHRVCAVAAVPAGPRRRARPACSSAVPSADRPCSLVPVAHAALPSITGRARVSSSSSPAGASWMTAPSRITSTRSARPSTSGTSLETSSTADALVGQPPDHRVQLGPGAHVHAPGRLVEQQQPACRRAASAPTTTFCWLPPDSVRDRPAASAGPQRRSGSATRGAPRPLAARGAPSRAGRTGRQVASVMLRVDRLAEQQRLALALLGGHARCPARPRADDRRPQRPARPPRPCPACGRRAP